MDSNIFVVYFTYHNRLVFVTHSKPSGRVLKPYSPDIRAAKKFDQPAAEKVCNWLVEHVTYSDPQMRIDRAQWRKNVREMIE